MSKRRAILALAAVSLLAVDAWAAEWRIDPAQSRLTFAGTQAGRPFQGSFEKFTANVRFDESDPTAGEATVVIDVASVRTGNAHGDDAVKGQDWFAVATYPQVHFETTSFRHLGGNRYQADAALTIRGVAKPVVLRSRWRRQTARRGRWASSSSTAPTSASVRAMGWPASGGPRGHDPLRSAGGASPVAAPQAIVHCV